SRVYSTAGAGMMKRAAVRTTSSPPRAATASANSRWISSGRATSAAKGMPRRPRARISAATASTSGRVRAATATSAPADARASAIPRPNPRPPPVTSARRPTSESVSTLPVHPVPRDDLLVEVDAKTRRLGNPRPPVHHLDVRPDEVAAERGRRNRILHERNLREGGGKVERGGHQDARLPGVRHAQRVVGGGEVGDPPALGESPGPRQIGLDHVHPPDLQEIPERTRQRLLLPRCDADAAGGRREPG